VFDFQKEEQYDNIIISRLNKRFFIVAVTRGTKTQRHPKRRIEIKTTRIKSRDESSF